MKLAYFPGCKIPFYMKDYGLSFKAAMQQLDIELVELPFSCCGYPAKNDNFEISILSSIRNLAIAYKHEIDIITPCKCCFGQLKHAIFWYLNNVTIKNRIDHFLSQENLIWNGSTQVKHLLSFLYNDYGLLKIKKRVRKNQSHKKLVVQYGCHALRPSNITNFDNPFEPRIFEKLLISIGVTPIDWSKKTECCGSPVLKNDNELALRLMKNKFSMAIKLGARYICTACTHCHMHYSTNGSDVSAVKPILITELLCDALAIDKHHPSLK